MEPSLTPPDPAADPLEALLRAAPPLIPDDGFSARVCAALPSPETPVPWSVRWLVLAGAALLGCVLAWRVLSLAEPELSKIVFAAVQGWIFEPWCVLPVLLGLTIWGTLAVTRNEWEASVLARG